MVNNVIEVVNYLIAARPSLLNFVIADTVARYLLLRQDDQALELLSQLVNEGATQRASVASWPLFDRVRQAGLLSGLMPEPGE